LKIHHPTMSKIVTIEADAKFKKIGNDAMCARSILDKLSLLAYGEKINRRLGKASNVLKSKLVDTEIVVIMQNDPKDCDDDVRYIHNIIRHLKSHNIPVRVVAS